MQLEAVFGLFIFIHLCFRLAGGPGAIQGGLMERVEKLSAVAEQCPTDGFLSPMQAVSFFLVVAQSSRTCPCLHFPYLYK